MSKSKGKVVQGDEARIAMGMKFSQEEFDELLALRKKAETQILSSKEQDRRFVLEQRKRQLG